MRSLQEVNIIFRKSVIILGACIAAWAVCGCNVGQTPAGGSDADVKAYFDKQPLDVRAKQIMGSPAPTEQKLARIKDMYKKEGKEVPAEFLQGGGTAH